MPDPFDPDNNSAPIAVHLEIERKCLQVDKLQSGGACEKAGVQIGDVLLRILSGSEASASDSSKKKSSPRNPYMPGTDDEEEEDGEKWIEVSTHSQLKAVYQGNQQFPVVDQDKNQKIQKQKNDTH